MHRRREAETQWSWELGGLSAGGLWHVFLKDTSFWRDCGGGMNMNYAEVWRAGKYPGVNESCIWEVGTSAQYGLGVWVWTVEEHSTQTGVCVWGGLGHGHLLPCGCRGSSPSMQVLTGVALVNEPFLAYRSHLTVASLALLCAVQKSWCSSFYERPQSNRTPSFCSCWALGSSLQTLYWMQSTGS